MTRSTTSSIPPAVAPLPPSTEPSARKRSRSGPRSLVPRLPHRAGVISPFAIIGRQVDGAFFASFIYQAQSWSKPRRVVAKVEWHQGELYPRVGFIVTNLK